MPEARPAAVSLDLMGTLLFPHPSVGRILARAARGCGVEVAGDELDRRYPAAVRGANVVTAGRARWDEIIALTLGSTVSRTDLKGIQEACWDALASPDSWRTGWGALASLAQLRFLGLRIFLVSEPSVPWENLLEAKGLGEWAERTLLGLDKRTPAGFSGMAKDLGLRPGEIVHIGSDPEADERIPRQAGLRTLLLRPDGLGGGGLPSIRRLGEAPERIRNWLLTRPEGRPVSRAGRDLLSELAGIPPSRLRAGRPSRPLDIAMDEAMRRLGADRPIPEHAVSAAWNSLLPAGLARRSSPLRILPDGLLLIHCESAVVRSELAFHARALAAKIQSLPGCSHVRGVGFTLKG